MRVLLVGIINWQGQITESCSRALRSIGVDHDIAPVADFAGLYDVSLMGRLRRRLRHIVKRPYSEEHSFTRAAVRQMEQPYDVVLILGGQQLGEATLREMRIRCDNTRARLTIWFYDDPFMQWSPPALRHDLLAASGVFDHAFVFDSYHLPKMTSWGFRNSSLLPLASDRHVFQSPSVSPAQAERYRADISFVGVPNHSRDRIMLSLADFDLAIYGATSYLDHRLRHLVRDTVVPLETTAVIYAMSKIVLNVNHPQSIHGSNCRTYDAALAGSVCLTDRKKDLQGQFVEGEELLCYERPEEVPSIVSSLLKEPERRLAMAKRGRERVLAEHTFEHRMQRVLELVGT